MRRHGRLKKRRLRTSQEGTWAVSYGDMITLLLGFYVMYFSIDPPKKGNTTLTASLIEALQKIDDVKVGENKSKAQEAPPQVEPEKTDLADSADGPAHSKKRAAKDKKPIAADASSAMQFIMNMILPKQMLEKISKSTLSAKNLEPYAPSMQSQPEKIAKDGAPTGSSTHQPKAAGYREDVTEIKALDAEASRIGDRVYIMFPHVSFFMSASTDMTPEGRQALEKFAKVYLPFSGKALLNIVGFSDERPVKGNYRFRDNLELSVLRAVSAQRVAETVGVPLNRTRLMGHGINTKLVDGEAASNAMERWALTRKIMLVIEPEVQ